MNETKNILQKARALITDPKNWTQKTMARDAQGGQVHPLSKYATCFCAGGALMKAGSYKVFPFAHQAIANAGGVLYNTALTATVINDQLGHEAVLKMFDYAIEHSGGLIR